MLDVPVIRRHLVEHYRTELRRIARLADVSSSETLQALFDATMTELERACLRQYGSEAEFIAEMDRLRARLRSRLSQERMDSCR